MKHLGLLPIILLLGMGITSGPVAAELTASQYVPLTASVGETVMVTVTLTNGGNDPTPVVVTPSLPVGVETDSPGGRPSQLYPGIPSPISYPIRAVQSGTYLLSSQVAYSEEGIWRNLRLESPFTAIGGQSPQPGAEPQPGSGLPIGTPGSGVPQTPGTPGGENPITPVTPDGEYPGTPGDEVPGGEMPPQSPEQGSPEQGSQEHGSQEQGPGDNQSGPA